ncbi:MAG: hypothetical protein ABI604_04905, partial [Nitrospirota bacterium]
GGNGPGVVIIIPFINTMVRVSVRTVTIDVAPQAVIYFRVVDQARAIAPQAEVEHERCAKVKSPTLLGEALELGGFLFLGYATGCRPLRSSSGDPWQVFDES